MLVTAKDARNGQHLAIAPSRLKPSRFSRSLYGDPASEIDDLIPSVRDHGILVPLVVAPSSYPDMWEVISGHRRLACALALGLTEVPCNIWPVLPGNARRVRS